MKNNDKLYVIVRSDLRPGHQAVQAMHAARAYRADHPESESEWFERSNHIALLTVKDEPSLEAIIKGAKRKGLLVSSFREPSLSDALTAVALEPGERTQRACSCLPLALGGNRR